jgi:DNA-binding winged helix-turn-helix (wHTH) protein
MKELSVRMKHAVLELNDVQEPECRFGTLRLEPDGTLFRGEKQIHLPPKELAALRVLIAHAGQVVSPLQLKKSLWGDVHVTIESVPRCVSSLRSALLPDDCIQTVYKRGYRFTAAVECHRSSVVDTLPRLAILPFAAGLNVPEYLGSAIAEETLAQLGARRSTFAEPFVILARDSVFTLAQNGRTARQVGQALHADLVLTGTLRAMPSHYRLRVEMIRVVDDAQLWIEDFFVSQSRLAGLEDDLVERLISRLCGGVLAIAAEAARPTETEDDPARREAYEKFLRGHQELHTLQRHRMQEGLQNLLRATELDPSLINAQIELVNVCITQSFWGFMSPAAAAEQARRTAKAIPENVNGATAILPALGWIRFHLDHNLDGALRAFAESAGLSHDPSTTRARVMFALSRHRFDEAIRLLDEALRLDPYSPWLHARLAWAWHLAGDAAQSVKQIESAITLFPGHESPCFYGAMILAHNGHGERAVKCAEGLIKISPYWDLATAIHGYALACAGRGSEAEAIVERLQWISRERYVASTFTAAICVALGDLDGAIAELLCAEEARCPWFFQMLADPRLKPLRGLPKFNRMLSTLAAMEADVAQSQRN